MEGDAVTRGQWEVEPLGFGTFCWLVRHKGGTAAGVPQVFRTYKAAKAEADRRNRAKVTPTTESPRHKRD